MNIVLMNNSQPANKINKTPSTISTLSGTLKENTSFTDPVVIIQSVTAPTANYAQISDFGRYYFIRDIVNQYNDIWELHMHVDVLKSYQSEIMSADCIVAKTASDHFNLYLPDPNFKCQQNERIGMQQFPNGFDTTNAHYYMTFFG